jgi:hypothetical protein
MFYDLPVELQQHIYSFDSTFKEKFDECILQIKTIPEFIDFNEEHDMYGFKCKGKRGAIFRYSFIHSKSYKDALKKSVF